MSEKRAVRSVRYGIGMKFGLFVGAILVATMVVVGLFVVKGQRSSLRGSLQQSMTSALLAYRDIVLRNMRGAMQKLDDRAGFIKQRREGFSRLRSYSGSLTNIKNCEQAMFVEGATTGRVFSDSRWRRDRFYSFMRPTKMANGDAQKKYGSIDFFISDMIDDREPYFVDSRSIPGKTQLAWVAKRNRAISNWNARVDVLNRRRKSRNLPLIRRAMMLKKPEPVGLSEGFLPIYLNYHKLFHPRTPVDHLKEGMALFRGWLKKEYSFRGRQSRSRREGLRFVALLERACGLFFLEEKKNGRITGVKQTAWFKLIVREKKGIAPGELILLRNSLLRLRQYRQPAAEGLLASAAAIRNFLVKFPDLKDRADDFPELSLWTRKVLERLPRPKSLPDAKKVPAAFRYKYRRLRNLYAYRYRSVIRPAAVYQVAFQKRLAAILRKVAANPTGRRLLVFTPAEKKVLSLAAAGKLFTAPLATRDALELMTASRYRAISELFYGSSNDKKWEEQLRKVAPYYAARRGSILPVPFYRDGEVGVHLKIFGQSFKTYLESGIFPRPKRFDFLRLSRVQKKGRAYRPAGKTEERRAFFRHVLRVAVAPFKVGFVRIILRTESLRRDLDRVAYSTADLGLSLVLRMVFFTFLLSGLFVRNIRRLAEGAKRVGQGDLDTVIELGTTDELGQLADQFNVMVEDIRESQVQLVEKSRMEEELQIAEQIQQRLLPETFPEVESVGFAGYYNAMTEAGGDYYDVVDVDEGIYGLVSADVSGHGVGAGLVMTMIRSVLRAQAPGLLQAQTVLRKMNPQIFRDTPSGVFATAFYGVLDTKKMELSYASAGHDPAILYNKEKGVFQFLEAAGTPIGMLPSAVFDGILKGYKLKLSPADTLIMYTDGVTEAMNGAKEEFQDERLKESVLRHGGLPLDDLVRAIVDDVKSFTGGLPQEDDISLLAFRIR